MDKKAIAVMVAMGCVISVLTGCGISEEEHNAIIAGVEAKAAADQDALSSNIVDLESLLQSEKNKIRTARIDLDDASERIKGLQQKSISATKALSAEQKKVATLEKELSLAQSTAVIAQDQAIDAESKFVALEKKYQELSNRFEMYQKNMASIKQVASEAPVPVAVSPMVEPESDSKSALDLLGEMGDM